MSPTQRSLKYLRDLGYVADVVERANKWIKRDYIGIGDIIAFNDEEVVMVQTTTADHLANRETKAQGIEDLPRWCSCPTRRFELHGWAFKGKAGKRKRWEVTIRTL